MSNSKGNANTICPFYIRETGSSLTCEGCMRGSMTTLRFGRAADKLAWQNRICMQYHFRRCPLACFAELKDER